MQLNKIIKSELVKIAVKKEQYPDLNMPEVAFAGRSNVGKSSLLNSIMNRKNLARTSSKPGKTRTINFYEVNDEVRLVDLPGYGYAVCSQNEKEKWKKYIEDYLSSRENLKAIVLVVDIRHEPSNDDVIMYEYIKHFCFRCIIVATKADKIARGKYQGAIQKIKKKLNATDEILAFSSLDKFGLERVKEKICEIIKGEI